MLVGLAALAIPPIIHLLNRRRYDVVDWGAMQFLQISEVTRRRLLIEELLLMLLRMGLIAVLVLALAGPFVDSAAAGPPGGRAATATWCWSSTARTAWATTARARRPTTPPRSGPAPSSTTWRPATAWPCSRPSSRWCRCSASRRHDLDWPCETHRDAAAARAAAATGRQAVQRGPAHPGAKSQRGRARHHPAERRPALRLGRRGQPVPLGTAGQRTGHGKPEAGRCPAARLGRQPRRPTAAANPPNWSLRRCASHRAVVPSSREITFRTALDLRRPDGVRSRRTASAWSRRQAGARPGGAARSAKLRERARCRCAFTTASRRPARTWSACWSPDPPPSSGRRATSQDACPATTARTSPSRWCRPLPVLLVDGDPSARKPKTRGTDFLRDALAPARDRRRWCRRGSCRSPEFDPALLAAAGAGPRDARARPRVLVLSNVARLTAAAAGGRRPVPGRRRRRAGHAGRARRCAGATTSSCTATARAGCRPASTAVRPPRTKDQHGRPAARELRPPGPGAVPRASRPAAWPDARFPRWWKLTSPEPRAPASPWPALDHGEYPFLVERPYHGRPGAGESVPLDNSWGTNLPDLPAFVPLAHELVYTSRRPCGRVRAALGGVQPAAGPAAPLPPGGRRDARQPEPGAAGRGQEAAGHRRLAASRCYLAQLVQSKPDRERHGTAEPGGVRGDERGGRLPAADAAGNRLLRRPARPARVRPDALQRGGPQAVAE